MMRCWFSFLAFGIFFFAKGQDSLFVQNEPLKYTQAQLIPPSILFTSGMLANGAFKYKIVDFRNDHFNGFHTRVDDFLSVSPLAFAYGLDFLGVPSKNDFNNRTAILIKAELMNIAVVSLLKYSTKVTRPDGSDNYSFPSFHTAQAFLSATFLSQEYKDRFPWMPYAAYSVASSVALLRIGNNSHFISDVLVGAGIGLLSQKIAYWTHQYKWKHCKKNSQIEF